MTKVESNSDGSSSVNFPKNPKEITLFTPAPFLRQLNTMLRISFLQRIRSPTLYIEIFLPVLFLVFVILFSNMVDPVDPAQRHTELDQNIPFAAVPGPSPHYGVIPKNAKTEELLESLSDASIIPGVIDDAIYFETFDNYRDWIIDNRETTEHFYCFQWKNSENSTNPQFVISSNGMTVGSLPDAFQALTRAAMNITKTPPISNPTIFVEYQPMPHQERFKADTDHALNVAIFSTVLYISGITVTCTNYGHEADSGLRDLFMFYGLSTSVNVVRWYIVGFVCFFIPTIPYTIVISALIKVNFGLILLYYFLGCLAINSFSLMLIALRPKETSGSLVGTGMLLTFFVFIFWGFFTWLNKETGQVEKHVLSIFPTAALGFTLTQIASGSVTSFDQINETKYYKVSTGLIYLAAESVVYFIIYVIIDRFKAHEWYPAPYKWKNQKPKTCDSSAPIVVEDLTKKYDDYAANDHISFSLELGEVLAIVGPNGAGKSTLMGMLSCCKVPTSGNILFQGVNITENIQTMHQLVGYCPQQNLFMPELKAVEWVKAICELRNNPKYDFNPIFLALGLDTQKARIGEMSGGNKRKVSLATALACDPPIVLLDEATSGVDFTSRTRIWSLISSMKGQTIIMATHTLEECEKIADRIMVMSSGSIAHFATPTELRQNFNCGYLIDIEQKNADALRNVLRENELNIMQSPSSEGRTQFVIPSEKNVSVSSILRSLTFPFILTVQSLEQKLFEEITRHEMQNIECTSDDSHGIDNQTEAI